ncbi:unnamed protein product [Colias eurytheme]|nr:unnamed protein product [Colias eurytheme]
MVRTKDGDGGIKSCSIVSEVQKRPCLFDTNHTNYGDRAEKLRCWEEVCESVVPGWFTLPETEKLAAGMLCYLAHLRMYVGAGSACGAGDTRNRSGCTARSTCVLFVRSGCFRNVPSSN